MYIESFTCQAFCALYISFFFFLILSKVQKRLIMTDIPPNPEDGELWLPSDVFHEIASSNINLRTASPNNNNNNGGADNTNHQPNNISTPTSLPYPPPCFHQVLLFFFNSSLSFPIQFFLVSQIYYMVLKWSTQSKFLSHC